MKQILMALVLASAALAQSAGPTAASLAACSGRAEQTECSVWLDDGHHDGVCMRAPRDEAASCMPKPVPPPPEPESTPPPLTASR